MPRSADGKQEHLFAERNIGTISAAGIISAAGASGTGGFYIKETDSIQAVIEERGDINPKFVGIAGKTTFHFISHVGYESVEAHREDIKGKTRWVV